MLLSIPFLSLCSYQRATYTISTILATTILLITTVQLTMKFSETETVTVLKRMTSPSRVILVVFNTIMLKVSRNQAIGKITAIKM